MCRFYLKFILILFLKEIKIRVEKKDSELNFPVLTPKTKTY